MDDKEEPEDSEGDESEGKTEVNTEEEPLEKQPDLNPSDKIYKPQRADTTDRADTAERAALNRMKGECDRMFKIIPHFDTSTKLPLHQRTVFNIVKNPIYHPDKFKRYPNCLKLYDSMRTLNKYQREIQWKISAIFKPDIKHLGGKLQDRINNYGIEKCVKVQYQPGMFREFVLDSVLNCHILRDMEDWHHKLATAYLLNDMNIVQLQKMHELYDIVNGTRLASFMIRLKGLHYNMPKWLQSVPPSRDLPELISRLNSEHPLGDAVKYLTYGISVDYIDTRLKMGGYDFTSIEGKKIRELLDNAQEKIKFIIHPRTVELQVVSKFDPDGSLEAIFQKTLSHSYAIKYRVSYNKSRKMFIEDSKGDLLFRIEWNPTTDLLEYYSNDADITNQFQVPGKAQGKILPLMEELNRRYQNEIGNFDLTKIGITQDFSTLFRSIRKQNSDSAFYDYITEVVKEDSEYFGMSETIDNLITMLDSDIPYRIGSETFTNGLKQYMIADGKIDKGGIYDTSFRKLVMELNESKEYISKHYQLISQLKKWSEIDDESLDIFKIIHDELMKNCPFGTETNQTITLLRKLYRNQQDIIRGPLRIDNFEDYTKVMHPGRGGRGIKINCELTLSAYLAGDPSDLKNYVRMSYLNDHLNPKLIPELADNILLRIKEQKLNSITPFGWGPIRYAKINYLRTLFSELLVKSNKPSDWIQWLSEGDNYRYLHYALNGVTTTLIRKESIQKLIRILHSSNLDTEQLLYDSPDVKRDIFQNDSVFSVVTALFPEEVKKVKDIDKDIDKDIE